MAESADAEDLKSSDPEGLCGFKSRSRHQWCKNPHTALTAGFICARKRRCEAILALLCRLVVKRLRFPRNHMGVALLEGHRNSSKSRKSRAWYRLPHEIASQPGTRRPKREFGPLVEDVIPHHSFGVSRKTGGLPFRSPRRSGRVSASERIQTPPGLWISQSGPSFYC